MAINVTSVDTAAWGTLSHVLTFKRNYFVVIRTVHRPFAVAACAHIDSVASWGSGMSNIHAIHYFASFFQ